MNKIILSGRLTTDGEIRTTNNQKEVYINSIAVKRNYKNANGEYESDFFNIILWNPMNYIKNYAKKGIRALIEGKIQQRNYEDKDKNKKYITEIIVENMEIYLDKKDNNVAEKKNISESEKIEDKDIEIPDEMLPF